ncbi:aminoglycoside adenylyltransferase domain-containing protein [Nocardioides pacificus]
MQPADLPAPVRGVCDGWLAAIDARAPGLVEGLYLRGGLAFGEWVEGRSDVDFVATLSRRPGDADVDALEDSHASLADDLPGVPFDGLHLLADDLTRPPAQCPDVPCVLHHHFEAEATHDVNPVTWHELAERGVTVRGPDVATLGIRTDPAALEAFTRDNLDTYWRATAAALAAQPAEGAREDACCWCVLGVARLHHLLVTGELTTKSGAGRWGLGFYPEQFSRVLREALRVREGGPDEFADDPCARGRDTAAFTTYVVEQGVAGRR